MIEARRLQLRFGDGLIAEEVSDLQEDWMRHASHVGGSERGGQNGSAGGSHQCHRSMAGGAPADLPGRRWQFDQPPWTPGAIHTGGRAAGKKQTG